MREKAPRARLRDIKDDGRTLVSMEELPGRLPFGLGAFAPPRRGRRRPLTQDGRSETAGWSAAGSPAVGSSADGETARVKLSARERWAIFRAAVQVIFPIMLIFILAMGLGLLLLLWLWGAL